MSQHSTLADSSRQGEFLMVALVWPVMPRRRCIRHPITRPPIGQGQQTWRERYVDPETANCQCLLQREYVDRGSEEGMAGRRRGRLTGCSSSWTCWRGMYGGVVQCSGEVARKDAGIARNNRQDPRCGHSCLTWFECWCRRRGG